MYSFRTARLAVIVCTALASPALAADPKSVAAPDLKAGDSWVFDRAHEQGTTGFSQRRLLLRIERVGTDTMVLGIKEEGAPKDFEDHLMGVDWSQRRLFGTEDTVTGRPFEFPLAIGATWSIDYVDPRRLGTRTSAHIHSVHKVVGWEDVTTPAGTFRALKIEANGTEEDQFVVPSVAVSGSTASPISGATSIAHAQRGGTGVQHVILYAALYYVPDVKYFVKTIEEVYNSENVRISRDTQTLVSFKPAQPAVTAQP